jgi:hypothetical protein
MADIEIVIKIPEKDYLTFSKLSEKEKINELTYYEKMIANGIPLPKGHGDLKDIDAINLYEEDFYEGADYERAIDAIVGAPTIIEADKEGE